MRISVVITSYNQKVYLVEAIDSVLAQTLTPHQIVIADDASTDGSQEVLTTLQARYPDLVKLIFHTQNQGVSQTRNSALSQVTGDYVTCLDGDDRFLPTKLEKEARLLRQFPQNTFVFSNFICMNAAGEALYSWATQKQMPEGDIFVAVMARDFPRGMLPNADLVPFSALRDVGFYDSDMLVLEDWELKIRLSKMLQARYCPEALSQYRLQQGSLSRVDSITKLHALDYVWEKNQSLLLDLPAADQRYVQQKLHSLRAMFMRRRAKEMLGAYGCRTQGQKREAWQVYRESWRQSKYVDLDLLAGLLLPVGVYGRLRRASRRLTGRKVF